MNARGTSCKGAGCPYCAWIACVARPPSLLEAAPPACPLLCRCEAVAFCRPPPCTPDADVLPRSAGAAPRNPPAPRSLLGPGMGGHTASDCVGLQRNDARTAVLQHRRPRAAIARGTNAEARKRLYLMWTMILDRPTRHLHQLAAHCADGAFAAICARSLSSLRDQTLQIADCIEERSADSGAKPTTLFANARMAIAASDLLLTRCVHPTAASSALKA